MSDTLSMNGADPAQRWEAQLAVVARALPYPATPELAPAVLAATGAQLPPARPSRVAWPPDSRTVPPRRTRGWALAAGLVALAALLVVPSVRASLVTIFELGVVRVILGPAPTETPAPTATGTPQPTVTPRPSPTPLDSVLQLGGETTLAEARELVNLPIVLPAYPADLGAPDRVFVQDLEGEAVVLVWLAEDDPSQVRLSLHILANSMLVEKLIKDQPAGFEFARVNGREAFWTTGPYYIVNRQGDYAMTRLISGHVLVWFDRTLTYRLETDLPLAEAIKIAESLE